MRVLVLAVLLASCSRTEGAKEVEKPAVYCIMQDREIDVEDSYFCYLGEEECIKQREDESLLGDCTLVARAMYCAETPFSTRECLVSEELCREEAKEGSECAKL